MKNDSYPPNVWKWNRLWEWDFLTIVHSPWWTGCPRARSLPPEGEGHHLPVRSVCSSGFARVLGSCWRRAERHRDGDCSAVWLPCPPLPFKLTDSLHLSKYAFLRVDNKAAPLSHLTHWMCQMWLIVCYPLALNWFLKLALGCITAMF